MMVIPRVAVNIPIRIPRSCAVEPVRKGSLDDETKHVPKYCNIQPKIVPKSRYDIKLGAFKYRPTYINKTVKMINMRIVFFGVFSFIIFDP